MNSQQQAPQEPVKTDVKAELNKAKTNLHNIRISLQVQEAIVKKLQEMTR